MEQGKNDLLPLGESPVDDYVGKLAAESAPDGHPEQFSPRQRVIALAVAVVIALVSALPVAEWASSPETYAGSISSLDAKAGNVTALVASSTAASVAITLLPDDIGSPIADKLVDIAADFAIVLGAIYLEKYLLTILGLAACRVVVPLACAAFALSMFRGPGSAERGRLLSLTVRLVLFALALGFVIPTSVWVSDKIEATYAYDISSVTTQMDSGSQEVDAQGESNASSDAGAQGDAADSSSDSTDSATTGNLFDQFIDWAGGLADQASEAASSVVDGVTSGVTGVLDAAKSWVSNLVEAFAVMIVTCCVIPVLVLFFFVWLINVLLGLDIQVPTGMFLKARGKLPRPGAKKKA